jgi:hypothetical protein
MLPDHNQTKLSRVMRVQPLPDEKPAPGFSWRDYEDVDADGEDDGWGVVKSKRPRKFRDSYHFTQKYITYVSKRALRARSRNKRVRIHIHFFTTCSNPKAAPKCKETRSPESCQGHGGKRSSRRSC